MSGRSQSPSMPPQQQQQQQRQPLLLLLLLAFAAACLPAANANAASSASSSHPYGPRLYTRSLYRLRGDFPDWQTRDWLGEVAGVAAASDGGSFVFDRRDRTWDEDSFSPNNSYNKLHLGPIKSKPIIELDKTGRPIGAVGEDFFYLPHGLSVGSEGSLWATDVARHQVVKVGADGKVARSLGVAFQPGSGREKFCKPTKAVEAQSGEVFVADGYCNHRIVKFDKHGVYQAEFGSKPRGGPLQPDELLIPHGLALLDSADLLCVADREHGRVQCYKAGLKDPKEFGKFVKTVASNLGRVYDVAFMPNGDLLIAHMYDNGFSMVTVLSERLERLSFRGNGLGRVHAVSASPSGRFLLIASLDGACPARRLDCFGPEAAYTPYKVIRYDSLYPELYGEIDE